jgi:hypothetical protein
MIRRTEPTKSLLEGCSYTNADHTDIRATFKRVRETAEDFANAYRLLSQHYPATYSLQRAAELALRKTK